MSTLSFHNDHFDDLFEVTNLSGNLTSKRRSIRKAVGEVGLVAFMPFVMTIQIIKIVKRRYLIERAIRNAVVKFYELDKRGKMKLESKFVNFYSEIEEQTAPIFKLLRSNNNFLSKVFITQLKAIMLSIKETTEKFTSVVYPNRVDPATDPKLFQELVDTYKGFDLTDWKAECSANKEKSAC